MDNLKQFADLKFMIESLEKQLEELKPLVLDQIQESGTKSIENELGTFTMKERIYWQYSKKVTEIENLLKATKQLEEADKTATIKTIIAFPQFTAKKEKINVE